MFFLRPLRQACVQRALLQLPQPSAGLIPPILFANIQDSPARHIFAGLQSAGRGRRISAHGHELSRC